MDNFSEEQPTGRKLDELVTDLPLLAEIAAQQGLTHCARRMKEAALAIRSLRTAALPSEQAGMMRLQQQALAKAAQLGHECLLSNQGGRPNEC